MSEAGTGAHAGVLDGGGQMGALMRAIDWRRTPLGPLETWPQSLRTTVSTCLNSRFPICCWWGPQLVKFYNDAYVPILGGKHPRSMGLPGAQVWPEIWHIIGPMLEGVLRDGEATWSENTHLPIVRRGFEEECYFTFSYSPIRDESGGVGGVFTAVSETTGQVIGERRLRTLKDLSAHTASATGVAEACARAAEVLGENAADLPFTRLYLPRDDGAPYDCYSTGSLAADDARALDLAADSVMADGRALRVSGVRHGELEVGGLFILPVRMGDARGSRGALAVRLSERLAFDERYRGFVELVGAQIGNALAHVSALQEAQRRAEALAALDRAKTTFFSNVSHELRTPLTLILGPVEDALASAERALQGEPLASVRRNAQRLLKLVNTLLDFARIEAGRERATFAPVDLAERTADLASAFRSAIERAGLRLEVACEHLPEPIYVDAGLWEKVVLNLLSNALKFTFEGRIRVAIRPVAHGAELEVSDTGVGIAEGDLDRIFDRFHRVEGVRSRTHEGTGIGLSLVDEIVRMHGGEIRVNSTPGKGTTFTVGLRTGTRHLPADQIAAAAAPRGGTAVASYVDEALGWTAHAPVLAPASAPGEALATRARILVADDNADMRAYVARLLSERWDVELAADGVEALEAARARPPDLIVTDWMMPRLDGIALLQELRAEPRTQHVPVLALSARAGEEARLDGLRAGMDDYLAKPFSSAELVGRVEAQLARARRRAVEDASNKRLRTLLQSAPVGIALLRGPRHVFELTNARYRELIAHRNVEGMALADALPELSDQGILELLDGVYRSGEPVVGRSLRVVMNRRAGVPSEEVFFDFVYEPVREDDGQISGILVVAFDVTDLTQARREAESANRAKDEFLAVLGHELRNPLAPILTALQLMRLRGPGGADRERGIIERQVQNLVRLVDDLLDVSRLTRGKVELKKARLELRDLVAEAIEMASPLLEERRHRLDVDVPEGLWVEADRSRMGQVLSNLLTNAAKYTPTGGQVEVKAGRDGAELWVSVRDNGTGISPQMLPRVFDLFAQERQPLERAAGGLGLGLAIVKSLVALHGGDVQVESRGRGHGAAFTVRLPAAGAAARVEPRPVLPEAVATRGARTVKVLVVDDNRDAAELLAEALELEGYVTRVAHDGPTALQVAEEFAPDIGLLDIGLPVMDGYELAARVRELPSTKDIRLVAITGYGQSSDRQRSAAAGFNAHLVKPIGIDEVEQVIGALTG